MSLFVVVKTLSQYRVNHRRPTLGALDISNNSILEIFFKKLPRIFYYH